MKEIIFRCSKTPLQINKINSCSFLWVVLSKDNNNYNSPKHPIVRSSECNNAIAHTSLGDK